MKTRVFETIRRKKIFKALAAWLALTMITEMVSPSVAWALTSGPSQPEVQSFEPVGTSDMVDLFTGDFNYNIPLFELPGPNGGYPFNLAYHSGIAMDQEASWVGLGWNLNPGAITREMRGFPDDFDGDSIKKKVDMRDMHTVGVSVSGNVELFGADKAKSDSANGAALGSLSLSLKGYWNNYKGIGYSLEPGFNLSHSIKSPAMGFGLSLDSQEGVGVGVNASLSMGDEKAINDTRYSLGIGFHSKRGLELSASLSATNKNGYKSNDFGGNFREKGSASGSSVYSFAERAYVPMVGEQRISNNIQVSFKTGVGLGAFKNLTFGGFYSIQHLHRKNKFRDYKAFGYNYLHNATNTSLTDFNREKDGMIHKKSNNLAVPQLTYDYYNVMGQGIGGMFRPYRSEIGTIHDPYVRSIGAGGSFGFEIGGGHVGFDFNLNYSNSTSQRWTDHNDWSNYFKFRAKKTFTQADYEDVYFKMRGEYTSFPTTELDFIGGEKPVKAEFDKQGTGLNRKYNPISGHLLDDSGNTISTDSSRNGRSRMPRNTSIQPITNDLLLDNNDEEILKEYDIEYYAQPGDYRTLSKSALTRLSRSGYLIKEGHIAGVTAVNSEGARYVYGLPAYNFEQYETRFTTAPPLNSFYQYGPKVEIDDDDNNGKPDYEIDDTEQYYSRTELPPYAHSYMLTSILGTDYVDVDNNGPSADDYGYWVKFNYVRTSGNYQWRAPFTDASYDHGLLTTHEDDKASYMYGKKENWHVATAETKTHIAVFHISSRDDGKDAYGEMPGASATGSNSSYKLDSISLYLRSEYEDTAQAPVPLKRVHFNYTYALCDSAENSSSGKLTLKEVWFTYQNNTRGELSKYRFDYDESNTLSNPDYSTYAYDRWGNYKRGSTAAEKMLFPYVRQFDRNATQTQAEKDTFKTAIDEDASVWNLRSITLPTGGVINIEYESDDYAYVQHKQAMQMFNISHLGYSSSGQIYDHNDDGITEWSKNESLNKLYRKIYFKLENPIDTSNNNVSWEIFRQYISGLRQNDGEYQLYFKIKAKLRTAGEDLEEFISGYCKLETESPGIDYGANTNLVENIGGTNCYTEGFITVKVPDTDNNSSQYHPFAVAAWQHLRTNQPDLLVAPGEVSVPINSTAPTAKAMKVKSLGSIIPTIQQMFSGYRDYAFNHEWANELDVDYSWIRLCTPDKIKFGGGCRVKSLTLNDKWDEMTGPTSPESASEYGQVYTYTTTEMVDGQEQVISSGVAQYEPLIGGDEIALRHAKTFVQEIPVKVDNQLFTEYPMNESHYPGPQVGYSKVTVQSLASDKVGKELISSNISTTGITEYEFYTAKDYPVITEETKITMKPFDLYIPLLFIGQLVQHDLTATQGYVIKLNDMHGKMKSVTYYARAANGDKVTTPVSSVKYYYQDEGRVLDGVSVRELDNEVTVLRKEYIDSNGKMVSDSSQAIIGEEYEFFTDQRQSRSNAINGGLDFNVEIFPALPFACPWPSISQSSQDVRTVVTNKIIHKTGILVKTVATDGTSTVVTENKKFDALTGRPLLVTVTNNFNDPIYKYEQPAYWMYNGMGAAYQDFGLTFYADVLNYNGTDKTFTINAGTIEKSSGGISISYNDLFTLLSEGDEFIVERGTSQGKATLVKKTGSCGNVTSLQFHLGSSFSMINGTEWKFDIVRSGRRNLLNATAGAITALSNPTHNSLRGVDSLSAVSYNSSGNTTALKNEIVAFLNAILCDGALPETIYSVTDGRFYNEDGESIMPTLSTVITHMQVESCNDASTCGSCETNLGYHLTYWYKQNGTCYSETCHCIAQKGSISSFSTAGGDSIRVYYSTGSPTTACLDCFDMTFTPKVTYLTKVLNASAVEFRDYWDYEGSSSCTSPTSYNPYVLGKKGVWRPFRDYYYRDDRYQRTAGSGGVELAQDGIFDGDGTNLRYYFFNWQPTVEAPRPVAWMPNNVITKYNENGFEVENKDILGLYSSALYGYDGTVNVAVGANTRQREMFFESADDPTGTAALTSWSGGNDISSAMAHTGDSSIKVVDSTTSILEPSLTLTAGKEYVLSYWVGRTGDPVPTYIDPSVSGTPGIKVSFYDASNTLISTTTLLQPSGRVTEKWQRAENTFTPPTGTASIKLKLIPGASYTSYFDDIRIFPSSGNMKSFVYDPRTFRLVGSLDENNYAAIYSYDEQGNLFLVKKETVNGIKTIQESRSHQVEQ